MYHRSNDDRDYLRAVIIARKCRTEHLPAECGAKYFTYCIYSLHSELGTLIKSIYR